MVLLFAERESTGVESLVVVCLSSGTCLAGGPMGVLGPRRRGNEKKQAAGTVFFLIFNVNVRNGDRSLVPYTGPRVSLYGFQTQIFARELF